MAQESDSKQDGNQVTKWLKVNDKKDLKSDKPGVLEEVIGKYSSFSDIALAYNNAAQLRAKFDVDKYGHLVASLVDKVALHWSCGT